MRHDHNPTSSFAKKDTEYDTPSVSSSDNVKQPTSSTASSSPNETLHSHYHHHEKHPRQRSSTRHSRILSSFTAPLLSASSRNSHRSDTRNSSQSHQKQQRHGRSLSLGSPPSAALSVPWSALIQGYALTAILIGIVTCVVFLTVPFASHTNYQVIIDDHPTSGTEHIPNINTSFLPVVVNITITTSTALNPVLHQIHLWNNGVASSCSLRRSLLVVLDQQFRVVKTVDISNRTTSIYHHYHHHSDTASIDSTAKRDRFVDANSMPLYPRYAITLHEVAYLPSDGGTWRWVCPRDPCQPKPYMGTHGDVEHSGVDSYWDRGGVEEYKRYRSTTYSTGLQLTPTSIRCFHNDDRLYLSHSTLPDALLSLVLAVSGVVISGTGIGVWLCFLGQGWLGDDRTARDDNAQRKETQSLLDSSDGMSNRHSIVTKF
eukprot:gb/GECH01003099.1/.p1 GENE.gb/GECH01003099.1/~~gb/GECH01003099.1/.p1  ORF type:complete len:430 (+),score=53.93 gb/GECH01003099.1/:1-1290(+)